MEKISHLKPIHKITFNKTSPFTKFLLIKKVSSRNFIPQWQAQSILFVLFVFKIYNIETKKKSPERNILFAGRLNKK